MPTITLDEDIYRLVPCPFCRKDTVLTARVGRFGISCHANGYEEPGEQVFGAGIGRGKATLGLQRIPMVKQNHAKDGEDPTQAAIFCTVCLSSGPKILIRKAKGYVATNAWRIQAMKEACVAWGLTSERPKWEKQEKEDRLREGGNDIMTLLRNKYLREGYQAFHDGILRHENEAPSAEMQATWDKGWSMAQDKLDLDPSVMETPDPLARDKALSFEEKVDEVGSALRPWTDKGK